MASVLKKLTGIDPFTVYAPTMSERLTLAEEDPMYRYATAHDLVRGPTIFMREGGACLGSGSCDAYVFWPRITVADGRANWMTTTMGRKATPVPEAIRSGEGLRLVQVFRDGQAETAVPVDQILVRDGEPWPALMLPIGTYWVRVIDAKGKAGGPVRLRV